MRTNSAQFWTRATMTIVFTIFAILGAHRSAGAVAFNDFDPKLNGGYGFNYQSYFNIAGPNNPGPERNYVDGQQFLCGTTGQLQDLILPISGVQEIEPWSGNVTIDLVDDTGGNLPELSETPLYQWVFTPPVYEGPIFTSDYPVTTLTATNGPTLTAGKEYWFITSAANTQWVGWGQCTTGSVGAVDAEGWKGYSPDGGTTWYYDGPSNSVPIGYLAAMEVDVSVPEPGSLALLSLGAASLLRRPRR
jgi:hypothetical protein